MINFPMPKSIPKERPRCRKVIIQDGLRPLLVSGKWGGHWCLDTDGNEAFMSDGLSKQMKRMIAEGYWSDITTPADSKSGG